MGAEKGVESVKSIEIKKHLPEFKMPSLQAPEFIKQLFPNQSSEKPVGKTNEVQPPVETRGYVEPVEVKVSAAKITPLPLTQEVKVKSVLESAKPNILPKFKKVKKSESLVGKKRNPERDFMNGVSVKKMKNGNIIFTINNRNLFFNNTPSIHDEGKLLLNELSSVLLKKTNYSVNVIGHTDNTPIRSSVKFRYPSNWELSASRAASVVRYFQVENGLPASRLSVISAGSSLPIAPNYTADGREENQRIQIALILNSSTSKKKEKAKRIYSGEEKLVDGKLVINQASDAVSPPSIQNDVKESKTTLTPCNISVDKNYVYPAFCKNIKHKKIESFYFGDASDVLPPQSAEKIRKHVLFLLRHGRLLSMNIKGYASPREFVSEGEESIDLLRLSRSRAINVASEFGKCLDVNRINVMAYGTDGLLYETWNNSEDRKNRRVDVLATVCDDF